MWLVATILDSVIEHFQYHRVLDGAAHKDINLGACRFCEGPPWCFWIEKVDFRGCLLKPPLFLVFSWLQDARQKFRSVLVEATVKLDELVKKIGKAVEDSKPYWEARRVARQVR